MTANTITFSWQHFTDTDFLKIVQKDGSQPETHPADLCVLDKQKTQVSGKLLRWALIGQPWRWKFLEGQFAFG
jgi:hypothetical protein